MPSEIQLDENLWFLYICLQKSDLKAIDFNAVGLATGLKSPAARMRYTRLRRQIESGSLNVGHGPAFSSAPPPASSSPNHQHSLEMTPASIPKKRKRGRKTETPVTIKKLKAGHRDIDKTNENVHNDVKDTSTLAKQSSSKEEDKRYDKSEASEKKVGKIKIESHSGSDAAFDSQGEDDENSEDEMPLAKLRKRTALGFSPPQSASCGSSMAGYVPDSASVPAQLGYSTYAISHSFAHGAHGSGNESVRGRATYVPRGFNALAVGAQSHRGYFAGRAFGNSGRRLKDGRSLYASPYSGWVAGRGQEDQVGIHHGPGWEYRARLQEQQSQNQHREEERGQGEGSEGPRKSI
ncbi:hypothetical protein ONS95_010981 [Cadophora gregata]|uniref:uncharacterized protein n=1 Tax=Cadophora gregata TaxID=51156 RepID=UPI0026DBF6E7|nr:uncharacterized protein ONS95_010981 [Cadophora gregata]KAK0119541.1 hypothetical protein ONS95_010981 [Cadophora gregata]KAK0120580.1 hypothetical protein ONS96_010784 [Cadophora gregata f. sp. sojae]